MDNENGGGGLMLAPVQTAVRAVSADAEMARHIQEIQAAIIVAKKCPRDENAAYAKIIEACKRPSLAEQAIYSFPRGNSTVSGPSIRLAEVLARAWGNIRTEVRELPGDRPGESEVQAVAWDLETNYYEVKTFTVKHVRHTKSGTYPLTDPRDIYEMVANQGARRKRACILAVIPGDIVEEAIKQVELTLKNTSSEPLKDRVRKMLTAFQSEYQVTQQMIERRLGHKLDAISETELVQLRGIYKALRDNMAKREDYFEHEVATGESEPTNPDGAERSGAKGGAKGNKGKGKGQKADPIVEPPSDTTEGATSSTVTEDGEVRDLPDGGAGWFKD